MSSIDTRNYVKFFEETEHLKISTKNGHKIQRPMPPKIKGKHFTNMDYLANAELIWLTPNCYPSHIFNPNSGDCYFEQCFRTCEKLGEGSYGAVIKVKSLEDGEFYAVKVAKEPFRNEVDRRLKIREVNNHYSLSNHPNVVRLYKAWEEDRFVYMQLELCYPSYEEGKPLSEKDCWSVLVDILLALHDIHESGRGHFDVKVENILLGDDGLFKLSDFGLMFKLKEAREVAKEGDAKYVAPELLLNNCFGEVDHFTPKADIFSLGISILELAGNLELPSHGDEWDALRNNIFPLAQTKHLSDDLFELLTKMMSRDPSVRPSAKEILDLPRVKTLAEQRRLLKLQHFLIHFNEPSIKDIVAFFVSLAWSMAITLLQLLSMLPRDSPQIPEIPECEETPKTQELMDIDCGTALGITVITGTPKKNGRSPRAASPEFPMSTNDDVSDDSGFVQELFGDRTTLFASTPMEQDESDNIDNIILQRVKKICRERSLSVNSEEGMADSAQCSGITSPLRPSSPVRPSPPPSQIYCDWVGLTSPDRALRESSVNKNRLHCPAESLIQYGISPLRLSKACKQDYREKKEVWENYLTSKRNGSIKFPPSPVLKLCTSEDYDNYLRQRSMTPRNLAKSFDDEEFYEKPA